MRRVACPHCGFQNFEISAYCGRCERPLPLRKKKPGPPRVETTPAQADPGRLSVPPPAPPRAEVAPMPIESTELLRAQEEAVYRKAEVRAATENLPEAEPSDAEAELDAIETFEAAGALGLDDDPPGEIEVPVQLASGLQIALARVIDIGVVLALGIAVAAFEALLLARPWHTRNSFFLDVVADWIHAHPDATLHGAIGLFVFGVAYNLAAGRRGGRTLGRLLTGTVLVRASGRALSWRFLIARLLLSLASLGFLGAGFFWALVDNQHRTWHDILTGTVVVRRRVRLPTV